MGKLGEEVWKGRLCWGMVGNIGDIKGFLSCCIIILFVDSIFLVHRAIDHNEGTMITDVALSFALISLYSCSLGWRKLSMPRIQTG